MSFSVPSFYRAAVRPTILLSLLILGLFLLLPPFPAYAAKEQLYGDVVVPPRGVYENISTTYGDIEVKGPCQGDVKTGFGDIGVYAPVRGQVETDFGDVYINAPVGGDVDVGHGDVRLGPAGRVDGRVLIDSGSLDGHPASRINGEMVMSSDLDPAEESRVLGIVGWFFGTLVFVAVAVLAAVFIPRQLSSSSRKIDESFGRSLLLGLASVPAAVILSVVLAVSLVGIPLLLLAAPAYLAFVFFGALVAAYFLGRRVLVATGRYHAGNALAAAVGALILSAAYLLPFVGEVLLYGFALVGTGAAIMALFSRRRPSYPSYETYVEERRV